MHDSVIKDCGVTNFRKRIELIFYGLLENFALHCIQILDSAI